MSSSLHLLLLGKRGTAVLVAGVVLGSLLSFSEGQRSRPLPGYAGGSRFRLQTSRHRIRDSAYAHPISEHPHHIAEATASYPVDQCDLAASKFKPLPMSHAGDECGCVPRLKGDTSQSEEDKAIHNRYFCGRSNGVFVEMGGLDGVLYSNTMMFEKAPLNWRGLLIEANPRNAAKIPHNRPLAKLAAEAACAEGVGSVKFGGDTAVGGVLNTMTNEHRERWVKDTDPVVDVPCRPLGTILREKGIDFIDFFSLDVEGAELMVLQTFDWSIPVRVWVIEFPRSPGARETNLKITELMAKHGYTCTGFFCEGGQPKGWDIMKECIPGRDCSANVVFQHSAFVVDQ